MKKYILFWFLLLVFSSCFTTRTKNTGNNVFDLKMEIENNPVLNKHFVGFSLFDPTSNKTILAINSDKLFTPASNIKILSFWTALNVLTDSLDIVQYGWIGKDSLVFRGTGYPYVLNTEYNRDTTLTHWLKSRTEKLFYSEDHFQMERLGDGWAWDDSGYYYQKDRSPLPLFGNAIDFYHHDNTTIVNPKELLTFIELSKGDKPQMEYANGKYKIQLDNQEYHRTLPFRTSRINTQNLLLLKTNRPINSSPICNSNVFTHQVRTKFVDSLYISLLHQSDNFIAEQLLMMCSNQLFDTIDTHRMIAYSKANFFNIKHQTMRWVDGSGLSRYNLVSPDLMVYVLNLIKNKIGMESIKTLFPSGGNNGTIKYNYSSSDHLRPYIYAKTGSLSNNHNLSGYLITKTGKTLIFSFMNNHFMGKSSIVKKEMESLLWQIRNRY